MWKPAINFDSEIVSGKVRVPRILLSSSYGEWHSRLPWLTGLLQRTTMSRFTETTSSQFLFLKSSARGTVYIMQLGKETRREWASCGSRLRRSPLALAPRISQPSQPKERKETARSLTFTHWAPENSISRVRWILDEVPRHSSCNSGCYPHNAWNYYVRR